jgi:hypothetical protein
MRWLLLDQIGPQLLSTSLARKSNTWLAASRPGAYATSTWLRIPDGPPTSVMCSGTSVSPKRFLSASDTGDERSACSAVSWPTRAWATSNFIGQAARSVTSAITLSSVAGDILLEPDTASSEAGWVADDAALEAGKARARSAFGTDSATLDAGLPQSRSASATASTPRPIERPRLQYSRALLDNAQLVRRGHEVAQAIQQARRILEIGTALKRRARAVGEPAGAVPTCVELNVQHGIAEHLAYVADDGARLDQPVQPHLARAVLDLAVADEQTATGVPSGASRSHPACRRPFARGAPK